MESQAMVVDQGQIASMKLPSGFSEQEEAKRDYPDYFRQFASDEDEDITLAFYYRGYRLSQEAAQKFQRMLKSGERNLAEQELQGISSILRDAADPESFRWLSSWVMSLNEMHVLVLKGIWTRSRRGSLTLFIDADGAGSAVQELHYVAPEAKFEAHAPAIMEAFKSIMWR